MLLRVVYVRLGSSFVYTTNVQNTSRLLSTARNQIYHICSSNLNPIAQRNLNPNPQFLHDPTPQRRLQHAARPQNRKSRRTPRNRGEMDRVPENLLAR